MLPFATICYIGHTSVYGSHALSPARCARSRGQVAPDARTHAALAACGRIARAENWQSLARGCRVAGALDRGAGKLEIMNETSQQFFQTAKGARVVAQTSDIVRVEAETFDGRSDAALAAIEHLVTEYEPKNWGKDEMEANDKFYEQVLTFVARHAMVDWDFEPEMTVFDAIMGIMATVEKQGGMQVTIGDLNGGLNEKPWDI